MRRKDKEITDFKKIEEILKTCAVCRLGLYDEENREVYMVPMNFAFLISDGRLTLFFHSAREGRKLDLLKSNSRVSFEMDCDHALISDELACEYSYRYSCLMGTGDAFFIEDAGRKAEILSLFMEKQCGLPITIEPRRTDSVAVIQINVSRFSCKCSQ